VLYLEVRSVLLSVLREVLEYKYRAPRILLSKWAFPGKLVLLVLSLVVSTTQPRSVVVIYVTALLVLLLVLGLWRSALYTALSVLALYTSMVLGALLLHGDVIRVARFVLVAASTLPVLVLTASTTTPSTFRKVPALYLLLVVFNSVVREIIDVATVYRARGVSGVKYWLRVVVASIVLSIARSSTLVDAFRARGVEVE